MIKIVADNKIPFLEGALERVARVVYLPGGEIFKSDLLDADALITRTRTACNRELLEGTSVQFIASATIGYDHIDTRYCEENGIAWTNAPGCNSSSVKQYLVSTLLWLVENRSFKLKDKTIGVIGVGNVGSKVADAAAALGMKVLLNDPPRERKEGSAAFVSLEELKQEADVITLHVPLNREGADKTLHMVNRNFLAGVKKGAILINSSRGAVVQDTALLEGIRSGVFSEVVLDVFDSEPVISQELLEALSLVTPHIAGYSMDGKANGTMMAVQAISRFFELGYKDWAPDAVPLPENRELLADASEEDLYALLWELVRQTYDVSADDKRLRANPGGFEKLRGDYPFRREPSAYAVRLFQGYPEIRSILERLDFDVLSDACM